MGEKGGQEGRREREEAKVSVRISLELVETKHRRTWEKLGKLRTHLGEGTGLRDSHGDTEDSVGPELALVGGLK